MPGIPLPNFTFATPSQSAATTPFSTPFSVGGAGGNGLALPSYLLIGVMALIGLYIYKKA